MALKMWNRVSELCEEGEGEGCWVHYEVDP